MDFSDINTKFFGANVLSATTFFRGLKIVQRNIGYESKESVESLFQVMNELAKYYYSWLASIVQYTDLYIMSVEFLVYFCRYHMAFYQFILTGQKTEKFRLIESDFKNALDLVISETAKWIRSEFLQNE